MDTWPEIELGSWQTQRDALIRALHAAGLTPADIASIRSGAVVPEACDVLEVCHDSARLDRFIPIAPPVRDAIAVYLTTCPHATGSALFVEEQGSPMTVRQVAEIVANASLTNQDNQSTAKSPTHAGGRRRRAETTSQGGCCDSAAPALQLPLFGEEEGGVGHRIALAEQLPDDIALPAASWFEQLARDGKAGGTIETYARAIRRLVAEISELRGEVLTIDAIRTLDLETVQAWQTRSLEAGTPPATVDVHCTVLRSFIYFLIGPDAIPPTAICAKRTRARAVASAITSHTAMRDTIEARQWMSEETWLTKRHHAIIALISEAGATPADITALSRSCLRLGPPPTILLAAGTKRERAVVLSSYTSNLIQQYVDACPFSLAEEEPLFVTERGTAISRYVLQLDMNRLADAFGLSGELSVRSIRRGAIAAMSDAGLRDFEIAERLKVVTLGSISEVFREVGRIPVVPGTSVRAKRYVAVGVPRVLRSFLASSMRDGTLTHDQLAAWRRVLTPLFDTKDDGATTDATQRILRFFDDRRSQLSGTRMTVQTLARIAGLFAKWSASVSSERSRVDAQGAAVTIPAFLASMLEDGDVSISTVEAYGSDLALFERHLSKHELHIVDVTPQCIAGYIEGVQLAGAKPSTASRAFSAIRKLFDWVVSTGQIESSPALAKAARPDIVLIRDPVELDSISPECADSLIDALASCGSELELCTALVASLASNEGLELREILALKQSDVFDNERNVATSITVNDQAIGLSYRTIQLLGHLGRGDLFLADGALIRPHNAGVQSEPVFRQTIARQLRRAGRRVGLHSLNVQQLRNSSIRRLLNRGLDYQTVRHRARLASLDQVSLSHAVRAS